MVFENIVVYLLDKYLGDYIENLDTKKLKIDLWSGNVVLENLYLKPNALADLNLPVTVSVGYLQKLILQVPWKNLYTHPTKATIDGLFLLVVPKTEVAYDAARDEKEQHEAKMREVNKIEVLRKEKEAAKDEDATEKKDDTFLERAQLQVIRNLELSIQNVHIVYEDRSTKPDHPFALGITLNYIKLHTTTPDWKPTILKEDTPVIHKLGELSAFSIYWNTDVQSRSKMSRDAIIDNLRARIAVDNKQTPTDIAYILRPLDVTAQLTLAMKPRQQNFDRPMFGIQVKLNEISLNINRDQYLDLLDLLEFQDYLSVKSKYIKYHAEEDEEVKPGAKRWKFAYEAIVNEEIRPRFECYKWKNIKAHLDRSKEYRAIHLQELTGKLTNEEKLRAVALEKKLDVFNLTYLRRSAEIEARKKKEKEPKTWWGSVSNWWGGSQPADDPELDLEKVMSPEEKQKLNEAIGYGGEDTSKSSYPETYVDINLAIDLEKLDVNVWSKLNPADTQFEMIASATIPDTRLGFRRRPANNAVALSVNLGSFQVMGISGEAPQARTTTESRPVLVQPVRRASSGGEVKLLQIEFETNPLDKSGDYRVKVVSQSLEIKYNAPTINKLAECFEQDTQRNLQGVKQVAYSTYTDVKQRSYILMKHNIEKIKVLDIDIDLQSSYFLMPENGVYQENGASICMDFGHLTLKRGMTSVDSGSELAAIKEAKDIDEARAKSYTQFKLKLEDIQLIYANRNESWENARREKNTPLHLIKPMELELDVGKCLYSDDAVLPAWKVAGNIPGVDLRLSDTRLFQIVQHMQSIPFPESKAPAMVEAADDVESPLVQSLNNDAEQTLEAVEGMTPVKKTKEKAEAEEQAENPTPGNEVKEKKKEFEGQLTQLEAVFILDKIDLHIDKATGETGVDEPFLRLTLESIIARTNVKTFDMQFEASLANLIVYHEQFIGKDNQPLRLVSAELDSQLTSANQKLVELCFLHTSKENPLFAGSTYHGIENQVGVHLSKLVITLQLEALLSIFKFQDSLMKKLPTDTPQDPAKKKLEETKEEAENKANEKVAKVVKKNDVPASPSLKIKADLKEFRIVLASKRVRLFDVQVQGIAAEVSQSSEKTLVGLVLSDLRIFDPYKEARYRKIISQQGNDKELLRVDLSLFNYPEGYEKPLDVFDCDVKVQFAKATIVFLFKHIDALLGFLDSLNVTKAALDIASTQAETAYEQVQKLQEQAFKVHLDITFNAPNIIIPTNSYSDEALFLDLGKLTLKTDFENDPVKLLVEKQNVQLENILASRVRLDPDYNILGEAVLLECTDLNTVINRLLFPAKVKDHPGVSIKVLWELVHFRLAKDDYSCVMKVLMENFAENIRDQIPENFQGESYRYMQEKQEKEEDELKDAVIKKQKELQGDEVLPTMKLRAEITKMALTLYLGESDLSTRHSARNDKLQLANVEIERLEAIFRQKSDGSYKATARVKNFLLDDLRATNKTESVTRMMDRHFTIDPDAQMLVAMFEFTPKSASQAIARRQLIAQLESLYVCISLDYLMTLQDFFISGLPSGNTPPKPQAITTAEQTDVDTNRPAAETKSTTAPPRTPTPAAKPAANPDADVETSVQVLIKHPEVILLEDQHNSNSNCLVLDLAFELRMTMVNNETKMYGWLRDLTVYSSNFGELRSSVDAASKVKYRILEPAKADVLMTMTDKEQRMDVRISDIIVSIAPAAVRTMIGVMGSLGTLQKNTDEEVEQINSKSLFAPKAFENTSFWFTKDIGAKVKQVDVLETVRGTPSDQKAIKEEENKIQAEEEEQAAAPPPTLVQQLVFTLETLELKLQVGLGTVTKSVVAMAVSAMTADVQNWSSNLSVSSTMNIEVALFNERLLAWEPLIEPVLSPDGKSFSTWGLTCSIIPALPFGAPSTSPVINEQERKEGVPAASAKQLILVRADQLLNITITKTGLNLVQRLSALFNDVYNKRLPPADDDDLPLLSVVNRTGREIQLDQFTGLTLASGTPSEPVALQNEQSEPLIAQHENEMPGRLSVIEDQARKNPEEFAVKIGEVVERVNINRTCKRVYELGDATGSNQLKLFLCDAQSQNDRRRIVFSSIVRIINNTTLPLLLLDINPDRPQQRTRVHRIDVNQDYYVPVDLLYAYEDQTIALAVDEGEEVTSHFTFHCFNDFSNEEKLQLKDGSPAYFEVFKEILPAYMDNTDQQTRGVMNIYVHPVLHLTNLLPIDIQCIIDDLPPIDFKPSELRMMSSGNWESSLKFTIPSYEGIQWVSDPVDKEKSGTGDNNEYLVVFHSVGSTSAQRTLRMILRCDIYHGSHRLSIYSPFWLLNRTNLKLEFQIENNRMFINPIEESYLVCPEKFTNEASKKAMIRVCNTTQVESATNWSEKFSLDVIKSTGSASCKVPNDRTYMICVDIVTSSFGFTKLVTMTPSMVISNKSTIGIEVTEIVSDKEPERWDPIGTDEVVPYWPRKDKDITMRVRYAHNQTVSSPFFISQKHRTLLRMDDEERPAICVEVTATDFDGVRVVFSDYKEGDAPLLVVNCLKDEPIYISQINDKHSQLLPALNYVYYTWPDPMKPRKLVVSCGTKNAEIELTPKCGSFGKDGERNVSYTIFIDGTQTVLLLSDNLKVIEAASGVPSLAEPMDQRIQIGIHNIGISIVNDDTSVEMLFISLSKSKVVWTDTKKSRVKPLPGEVNARLEELYQKHRAQREANPEDSQLLVAKYQSEDYREIIFQDDSATVINSKGRRKHPKRQALDGLWIEYAWSVSNSALHLRINRLQIDNQQEYTMFPVMLHPVISKAAGTDHADKAFIELSIYQSKTNRSNIVQYKYFCVLIQEFAVKIDQGLIVSLLGFLRPPDSVGAPTINMDADLEQIKRPLALIVKAQIDTPTNEAEMYFDRIHLSPLKIHVSFSMHGSNPSQEQLVEYPLLAFLLQTLNVAEVQDVVLCLGYFERQHETLTTTKITTAVTGHYQNQFMKQLHVLVLGLDVLGNPLGVIRGLADGVESFFYEPYKGAIEGPMEFAEGVATGVKSLLGSAVGGAAGAVSKITGVVGKGLATFTFDDEYKASRIRRKEPSAGAVSDIAAAGKNVLMGFVDGVTGVVTKPVAGAKEKGATGFFKGFGKGVIGLVARPTGGVVDFATTSFDIVKRTAQPEEIVRRVRYPRHIADDRLIRPYIAHDATGFYILKRLEDGKYISLKDTYVAHIKCLDNPPSWLVATSKRLLFVQEISLLGTYDLDWEIGYEDIQERPTIRPDTMQIQILTKEAQKTGTLRAHRSYGKLVKYRKLYDAEYIIGKINSAMQIAGF